MRLIPAAGRIFIWTGLLVSAAAGPLKADAAGFPVPPRLRLTVRETAGIARSGEVIRSGVPLPRSLNLTSTQGLGIRSQDGRLQPAEFTVLARWDTGLTDSSRPIQWLLVSFPASIEANGSSQYELVWPPEGGTGPAPSPGLTVERDGGTITVRTGTAVFVAGGTSGALFDEIRLPGGVPLAGAGSISANLLQPAAGQIGCRAGQQISVAFQGSLTAVVRIENTLDWPGSGGGGLRLIRRYVFRAGSPVALVRLSLAWEGDRCPPAGNLYCDSDGDGLAEPNGILLDRLSFTLVPLLPRPRAVRLAGPRDQAYLDGTIAAGETAGIRQRLRARRLDPLRCEIQRPGQSLQAGTGASGGMLAIGGTGGALAVALNHMHRFEPQALQVNENGELAIHAADDLVWLGAHQGLFADLAVGAFPEMPDRAGLDRLLWAPLNRPLRAWPTAAWFSGSGAVEELPAGTLPPPVAAWRDHVPELLARTVRRLEDKGLPGLMTFGLFPRYWDYPGYDEIDCEESSPLAGPAWDDKYWCGTWTDYHQTVSTAAVWAMASGETEWLDELAFPGASRVLHTQIMQCAPGDDWFYCGQCPSGYGGYRADFNSSHAYFENLFLYYWLTGDETVVSTLERGARTMREYLCSRRPGQACGPDDPPVDIWSALGGRVAAQWLLTFRFLGLAGADPSYLEDWRGGMARLFTQHYVEGPAGGAVCGFLTDSPLEGPGEYFTSQFWMASFYEWNNLNRLRVDTGDASLGEPALAPGRLMAAWAQTLARFGPETAPGADGTAAGPWPNVLRFRWQGDRTRAVLEEVEYGELPGSDPLLWDTGKSSLTALLMRAARSTGDPLLRQTGSALVEYGLAAAIQSGVPLGKECGLFLTRLHPAVAQYAALYFPRGDINADGVVNTVDLAILRHVLAGNLEAGDPPAGNPAGGDWTGDGRLDAADFQGLARELAGMPGIPPPPATGRIAGTDGR